MAPSTKINSLHKNENMANFCEISINSFKSILIIPIIILFVLNSYFEETTETLNLCVELNKISDVEGSEMIYK